MSTGGRSPAPRAGARVRMAPGDRRAQLLDLGLTMLSGRPVGELSVDLLAERAGVSRGLLYHYFGSKQDFHRAVVRAAADRLIAVTEPPAEGTPLQRLAASLGAYVDYVAAHYEGYTWLVRGAAGGDEAMRQIYQEARAALTDRVFTADGGALLEAFGLRDTPAARLMVRGWAALVEEVVLAWVADDAAVAKADLLDLLAGALAGVLPRPAPE